MKKSHVIPWITLIVGIGVFALSVHAITGWLTNICIPYNAKAEKIEKTLYSDDEDMQQVDICLIGGSHGLNGFNPNVLWTNYGLHAYNYCYAGETIALSKAYLEELYKKHDFQLVVLDIYYAGIADMFFGEDSYAYDVLNKMKPTDATEAYIENHVHEEVRKDYTFPLNRFHTRWVELTDEDWERKPNTRDDWLLGQDIHYEQNDGHRVHFREWPVRTGSIELKGSTEQDLCDFIELAKSHGSQVLLADLPRRYNDSLAPARWLGDEYAVVNRVRQIASRYQTEVLQFDEEGLKDIGFKPEKHMYNKGHMNIEGSEVYTRALGRYITEHFVLNRYERRAGDIREVYALQYAQEKKKRK